MNKQNNLQTYVLLLVIVASYGFVYAFGQSLMSAPAEIGAINGSDKEQTSVAALAEDTPQLAAVSAAALSDKVVITTTADGKSHTFLKSEAVDKGSFTSPAGFTQKNLCDTSTLPDMTVCFRPDSDGSRDEVVFEYGTFMKTPTNTGAYTAAFFNGSTKLGEKSVPNQYFYQRWRWIPQGYRPRYRTLASIETAKLIPPYRKGVDPDTRMDNIPAADPKCLYVNVFDHACITEYMGMTGERPDIGPVTEWQGNYLLTQSDDWWQAVLSQAEAGMGIPWNIRDEGGTPVNMYRTGTGIVDRLRLTSHGNSAGQAYYLDRVTNDNTTWAIDQSHQPALFYLPWILTGDPYYLEGLQFVNSNNVLYTNWARTSANLHDITQDQLRGNAWNLRTLIQLVATSPDTVPGWLLPRSYFVRESNENAQLTINNYVKDPALLSSVLHSWLHGGFWQQDFYTYITGWGMYMGLTEWKPVYDFTVQNALARVNGTSGWERRCPTVYYLPAGTYSSWAATWELERTVNNRVVPTDGTLCEVSAYTTYLLGALSMATYLGVPGADSYHLWLYDMMKKTLAAHGGYTQGSKWAIAPKYKMDGTLPALPDITDPAPLPQPQPIPQPIPTPDPTPAPDTAAPSAPGNLNLSSGSNSFSLTWTASTDNVGVTEYRIFRNSTLLNTVTGTSYTDTNVNANTDYTYAVAAVDAAGNQSTLSNTVTGKITTAPTENSTNLEIVSITGDFTAQNTCSTIALGASCSLVVSFAPKTAGGHQGVLSLKDSRTGNTQSIKLYGNSVLADISNEKQSFIASIFSKLFSGILAIFQKEDEKDQNFAALTLSVSPVSLTFDTTLVGQSSSKNLTISFTESGITAVSDTKAPTTPQNLSAKAGTTGITLTWRASTDNVGVTEYRIYRNSSFLAAITGTSYIDAAVTRGKKYSYTVSAVDAAGNESRRSTKATVTMSTSGGTESVTLIKSTLRLGSRGEEVKILQRYLTTKGYLASDSVTGYFGNLTETAVKTLQCSLGLICSGTVRDGWGVVGPRTREKINADLLN